MKGEPNSPFDYGDKVERDLAVPELEPIHIIIKTEIHVVRNVVIPSETLNLLWGLKHKTVTPHFFKRFLERDSRKSENDSMEAKEPMKLETKWIEMEDLQRRVR